jgi:hypothetical protein
LLIGIEYQRNSPIGELSTFYGRIGPSLAAWLLGNMIWNISLEERNIGHIHASNVSTNQTIPKSYTRNYGSTAGIRHLFSADFIFICWMAWDYSGTYNLTNDCDFT